MRNWPYEYGIGQTGSMKGKFDVTVLPQTGANASVGTVGGWQLGGLEVLEERLASIEFVRYMTSPAVKRYDAIIDSNVPTIPAVAKLPAVRKENPYLKPQIASVARVTRPRGTWGRTTTRGRRSSTRASTRSSTGRTRRTCCRGWPAARTDHEVEAIGRI